MNAPRVLAAAVVLALAACGGLSDQEAAGLVATALHGTGDEFSDSAPTDGEIDCMASGIVDEVGPGIVDKYGLAEESLDDVALDEGDADSVAGVVIECIQVREESVTALVQEIRTRFSESPDFPDLSDEQLGNVRNCLDVTTDWSLLQQSVSLDLQGRTADAEKMGDDLYDHGSEVGTNCMAGALVQVIREESIADLQAAGATEEQAMCFQANFDFDLYRQLIVAESSGGDAEQAERVSALIEAETDSTVERCR